MTEQFLINGTDIKEDPKVLCIAVEYGNLKIVEDLLKSGADPNVIDKSMLFRGQRPLHIAVRLNHVEIAKLLIKYGADVNVKDREGETPIIFAIQKNNTEMIQLLLTKGADIKDPNVLCIAVENGNLKIVEDLLKNGADANMIYNLNTGDTLVDSAVCWREFVSAKLMMKYRCYVDTRYNVIGNLNWFRGLTLLHIAVVGNQVAMVKLLIKYGADINVKGKARATPIVYAIRAENTEIFELLLTNGADIKDPKVLCIAVEYGNLKIVEDLLKNGADPNVIGKSMLFRGQRPLHIAVRWNQVEFAKLLIKYGADVNVKDKAGETPIIYAIQKNNTKMIELLLTSGADTKDVNTNLLRVDSPTTKILKQHIAKVKAAGLYVSERNLLWISNDYEINNFVNECEAEIQIMKSKKIDNSCASFYDILTKNKSELAKNESIVQALKSDGYKTKFPIYATMIDSRFRRWLEREKLLEQFRKKFLHSLFESLPELPFLCTEKIFNYLSDLDLRMLLVA